MHPIKITADMTTEQIRAACKANRDFVDSYFPENPTSEELQDAADVEATNRSISRSLRLV
jgi:hypothetical protein